MFENLIESKPKKQRTVGQSVVSVVLHGILIFFAVKATQGVAEAVDDGPIDTTMVFLKPPEPPPPPPPPPPEEVVVVQNPPPKGFQTIVAPTDIPKDIPPIDLKEKAFDPKDFTGKGVEGGIATGVVGGTGSGGCQGGGLHGGRAGRSGPADHPAAAAVSAGAPERRDRRVGGHAVHRRHHRSCRGRARSRSSSRPIRRSRSRPAKPS